jgi:hypothetical protein
MGTEAAVEMLSELVASHPEFARLPYELSLAERAMRMATWSPLTSKEVLALTDKPDLQLVISPADLCQVLIAALDKYAAALHGAQTPVRDLCDRQGGKDISARSKEIYLTAWPEEMVLRLGPAAVMYANQFPNADPG